VSAEEIFSTTLTVMIYRQYTDGTYMTPVTDKIVPAGVNEPPAEMRVPGCVLWADVGDTVWHCCVSRSRDLLAEIVRLDDACKC
jgi:hypothetical protein